MYPDQKHDDDAQDPQEREPLFQTALYVVPSENLNQRLDVIPWYTSGFQ